MNSWITTVSQILDQGSPLVMATVVSHDGSTPRGTGTRMILGPDQSVSGTVGGGRIEATTLQTAYDIIGSRKWIIQSFDLTSEIADQMDMICGGRMEILIESMTPDEGTSRFFKEAIQILNSRRKGVMVSELPGVSTDISQINRMIFQENGETIGQIPMSPALMAEMNEMAGTLRMPVLKTDGNMRFLVEPARSGDTVYILGAGHVGLQTAILAQMTGFRTVVLDDRIEFANRDRFPDADEVRVLDSFTHAFHEHEILEDAYIVILTRGHLHDKTVLSQALKTPAGYIGMIGSRKKRDTLYRALECEGFSGRDFERVFSPVGLSIGARTPEEIAVSIVAELIQVRALKQNS